MPDTDTIVIRPLAPADETAWRALWKAYLEFYKTTVPEDVSEATFKRLCAADHPDQNGLLAVQDRTPVGLAHYIYHPHNWHLEKVCYLQDIFVTPMARGAGVGHDLIKAVYAAADSDGHPSVYWLTQTFNIPARRLYDRVGTVTPFIKYVRR